METKKRFKKLVSLLTALSLLYSFSISAFAGPTGGTVSPMWTNTSTIGTGITFNGTTAQCTASIDGYSGTTKISATYELQQKSGTTYTTIKTWTASANAEYLDWTNSYTVTKGYTYRLYVTAKVTRNGTTETANGWTEATLK